LKKQSFVKSLELTAREHEMLEHLMIGISIKDIAEKEFISLATVKTHTNNIYKKAGFSSRHAPLYGYTPLKTSSQ